MKILMLVSLFTVSVLLTSCGFSSEAARPDARRDAPARRVKKPRPRLWTADELAEAIGNAQECEAHARHLLTDDEDKAWALLSACVRRRNFTDLGRLTSPPWLPLVEARPEGALLVAQTISARGGDVRFDLSMVQRRRLPLFSLRAALEEPETYAGRLLVVRGRAVSARGDGKRRALLLRETHVVAVRQRDATRRGTQWVERDDGDARTSTRTRWSEVLRNVSVETGEEVLAHATADDPFVEPHADYVFLLRFDGAPPLVEADDAEAPDELGMASVLAAFAPTSGRFEYAAHR